MSLPLMQTSFIAGEVTPSLFGHADLAKMHAAAATMRNCFVSYRGGAYSRAGTAFVGYSRQTQLMSSVSPRVITFQFSINQGLMLEFGNEYMRVVANGAYVTETPKTIVNISNANPAVVTVTSHGYSNGDAIALENTGGMPAMNDRIVIVAGATTNTFQATDVFGNNIDSTTFGSYTASSGTAGRVYTLATPYAEADLVYLKYVESADVMSLCCWNQITNTLYSPYELTRLADDNWTLTALTVGANITPPASTTAAATVTTGSNPTNYQYVITAVSATTGEESVASPIANVPDSVNIATTAGSENIEWSPVVGAGYYNVYQALPAYASTVPPGSLFGFLSTTYGTEFVDTNITADFTQVPPTHQDPFAPGQIIRVNVTTVGSSLTSVTATITTSTGSGFVGYPVIDAAGHLDAYVVEDPGKNYAPGDTITFTANVGGTAPTGTLTIGPQTGTFPSVVAYFQQRRVYGSSPNNPDTYWMSQPGNFYNYDFRIPTVASDAITGTPWSVEVNGIQFMVQMVGGLVVLTGLSAWQVTGAGGSALNPVAITPSSQQAQPQAYNGCSATIPPIKINNEIIYVQAKGSIIRDLSYTIWLNTYTGVDLTQLSSHLFTGFTIAEGSGMAYCEEPFKIIWVVRNDGVMLSLTFLKEQEVSGWARHDTQGLFKNVCSVTEPPVDALYVVVQRFVNGQTAFMIERMDNRIWPAAEDCWCVDCGVQTSQPTPNATITASSPTGAGRITGVTNLVGGANYSAATYAVVTDDNGEGPGFGAAPHITVTAGVITAVTFAGPGEGTDYTFPTIAFVDPTGAGSGASATLTLNNTAIFTTSAPVFSISSVGDIIRMGNGIAEITSYTSSTVVQADILSPITSTIPGLPLIPFPQPAGEWTLTVPISRVYGLSHLAGATVTGLADGNVIPPTVVNFDGSVLLSTPATAITIGLSFQPQLQSVYLDSGAPTGQGQRKKISQVTIRAENSRGLKVGCNQDDGSTLSPMQIAPQWQNLDIVPDTVPGGVMAAYNALCPALYTGDRRAMISGGFQKPGQVAVQQDNPLPMQILAVIPEVFEGDTPQLRAQPQQGR